MTSKTNLSPLRYMNYASDRITVADICLNKLSNVWIINSVGSWKIVIRIKFNA